MSALTLSHLGVSVRVLDRRYVFTCVAHGPRRVRSYVLACSIAGETAGQGDGIQPRMLEIWDTLGLGAELRAVGNHIHRMVCLLLRFYGASLSFLRRKVIYVPNDELTGIKVSISVWWPFIFCLDGSTCSGGKPDLRRTCRLHPVSLRS